MIKGVPEKSTQNTEEIKGDRFIEESSMGLK